MPWGEVIVMSAMLVVGLTIVVFVVPTIVNDANDITSQLQPSLQTASWVPLIDNISEQYTPVFITMSGKLDKLSYSEEINGTLNRIAYSFENDINDVVIYDVSDSEYQLLVMAGEQSELVTFVCEQKDDELWLKELTIGNTINTVAEPVTEEPKNDSIDWLFIIPISVSCSALVIAFYNFRRSSRNLSSLNYYSREITILRRENERLKKQIKEKETQVAKPKPKKPELPKDNNTSSRILKAQQIVGVKDDIKNK